MKTLTRLLEWTYLFRDKHGECPAFIPIQKVEIVQAIKEEPENMYTVIQPDTQQIFGHDVFQTPFAEHIRTRQISVPLCRIEEHAKVSPTSLNLKLITDRQVFDYMFRKLEATVTKDTTELALVLEWDLFASIKRLLHVTKWFPIKTKPVRVNCVALYPYLKLSLPHNRHHVTFTKL